jgi:peptidyl-prolyl cis-trans isomerase D
MLTKIREKTQGIIATFILALIVIPFALWGINSYFEGGSRIHVAEVNGNDITQQDYRRALEPFRGRLEPAMLDSRAFKEQVLEGLIGQTLLVEDAVRQGYRLSDSRLAERIRQEPFFQSDGRFDPRRYEALLRQEGMTPRDYETRLREQNLTGQIQSGLAGSGIVTEAEVNALIQLLRQERELTSITISPEPFLAKAAVSPEELESYYAGHPELGKSPEQARIAYLRLSAADLVQHYQPNQEELEKAYVEEAARYTKPAKRRAAHILIQLPTGTGEDAAPPALARIQDLEQQLRAGADFAGLARKFSDDKDSGAKGGDLGEIRPGVLPKEVEAALTNLKLGQVSAPVRSTYGYHLIKLTALTPEARQSLNAVKPELVKLVRRRKGEEKFYEAAEKFRDLVYSQPESLEPTAKALGLEIQTSGWFTRNVAGTSVSGITTDPRVVEAAFQPEVLARTRNSDAIELNAETLVAVRVLEHRPATRQTLAELKPRIERLLKEEKARTSAQQQGETWLKQLQAGETFEALAQRHGLKLPARKSVTRDSKGSDPRVLQAAFRAGRPAPGKASYSGVDLGSQGYALVAVTRVVDADPAKIDPAAREKAKRLLAERRGAGYYASYRDGLRQQAKVRLYPDKL